MTSDHLPTLLRRTIPALLILGIFGPAIARGEEAAQAPAKNPAPRPVDFDRDIRPLLANTCYTCHGPDEQQRQAELRLDTRAGAFAERDGLQVLVPGKPEASALFQRITSADEAERMPPPEATQQLKPAEIELIRRWIAQGADWQEHWAFVPPQRPELPPIRHTDWPRNPIDHFILARLEQDGLTPSPEAPRETLIRRVTLDLTGLPPTIEEIDAFLADDSSEAYGKVVDRLLKSPRYGEHMATAWLDAARYADSNGYQREATRTMWPWRDWVIRALNDNMPFDQFTIEQLAGDLLPEATREQKLATGFNRNHMLNGEGGRIAEESRVEYVVDRLETTSATWLGLTLGCARCHDHKYDPITQREFYGFYAYFNSIDESGRVDRGGNANPVMPLPTSKQSQQQEELANSLAELQQKLKDRSRPEVIAAWEADTLAAAAADNVPKAWTLLRPARMESRESATLTLRDDLAIDVTGANPDNDIYTLELPTDLTGITGLRLEALADARFTNGGLARSNSGNFVLTGIEIEVHPAGEGKAEPITIASAQADYEQAGHPVQRAYDGNPATGWAVYTGGDMKHDRRAMFVFDKPLAGGEGTILKVTLRHESQHAHHNLGRFRLAATTRPKPSLDDSEKFPAALLAALQIESDKRTADQQKLIREHFLKSDPVAVALDKEITQIRGQQDRLRKSIVETMIMQDRAEPRETFVLKRGQWDQPDTEQPVTPHVPAALPPLPADAPTNRLALARWIVDPANPLTARVIVNRDWQRFFGVGLVKTSEDFGTQGERPSHPRLLDWLATEFVRTGWDVKAMHRQIVLSATYRQSSQVTPELLQRDPENRLLARAPRFRLTSQQIRDQALAVSGLLVEQVGGPPVKPYQPAGVWLDMTLGKIKYVQDHGENLYRRSLYTFWRRSVGPTMLFDTTARQVCTVRQSRTNTPLHALTLLNDITYVEAARVLAQRLLADDQLSHEERMARAFRMVTARRPEPAETAAMLRLHERLHKQYVQNPAAAEELVSTGEAPRDESLSLADLAATTGVMNALLNLDEVITRE